MNATTIQIQVGEVVQRINEPVGRFSAEIGDVVEKKGDRCRVAWRDRQKPSFYRSEEMITVKGKRTWVRQDRLVRVPA